MVRRRVKGLVHGLAKLMKRLMMDAVVDGGVLLAFVEEPREEEFADVAGAGWL